MKSLNSMANKSSRDFKVMLPISHFQNKTPKSKMFVSNITYSIRKTLKVSYLVQMWISNPKLKIDLTHKHHAQVRCNSECDKPYKPAQKFEPNVFSNFGIGSVNVQSEMSLFNVIGFCSASCARAACWCPFNP